MAITIIMVSIKEACILATLMDAKEPKNIIYESDGKHVVQFECRIRDFELLVHTADIPAEEGQRVYGEILTEWQLTH